MQASAVYFEFQNHVFNARGWSVRQKHIAYIYIYTHTHTHTRVYMTVRTIHQQNNVAQQNFLLESKAHFV